MEDKIDKQPDPYKSQDGPIIHELVMTDIGHRMKKGIETYDAALQPFNGRNSLVDAYEECLDQACYLRQRISEDNALANIFRREAEDEKSWIADVIETLEDLEQSCPFCSDPENPLWRHRHNCPIVLHVFYLTKPLRKLLEDKTVDL